VPELEEGWSPSPDFTHVLDKLARCQAAVGVDAAVPSIIGPVTFAALARQPGVAQPLSIMESVQRLLPAYTSLLQNLRAKQVCVCVGGGASFAATFTSLTSDA
jgi:hypothetical protein